jgi:hypothetical protein
LSPIWKKLGHGTRQKQPKAGARLQASGFREQPNSQTARTIEDNRPTVNSQDDWGQSPDGKGMLERVKRAAVWLLS